MPSNIEIIKHKLCDDFPLLFVKNSQTETTPRPPYVLNNFTISIILLI